jgi:hypothetical protein
LQIGLMFKKYSISVLMSTMLHNIC